MGAPHQRDDAALLADARRRAAALHDALDRDRASLAGSDRWPEGPALYSNAIEALDRVIRELTLLAELYDNNDGDDPAHRSESAPP